METDLEYEVNNGVRYVVVYTNSGANFYLSPLCTKFEEADAEAKNLIKDKPAISDRLGIMKVKAIGPFDISKGLPEVMVWTKNPRFFCLEAIYPVPGKARGSIKGPLEEYFMISTFAKEIFMTYKNESRA